MRLNNFLVDLKRALPTDAFPFVVSGLRHDDLVWETLEEPETFEQVLTRTSGQAKLWNPASLALIYLGEDGSLEALKSLPLQSIASELRQQAVRAYEDTIRSGVAPSSLGKAGLIALALRERRRLTGTWQGLLVELQGKTAGGSTIPLKVWHTPLACLFAMAPDPVDLIKLLVSVDAVDISSDQIHLALHSILSNPLSPDEHISFLVDLLGDFPIQSQARWLEAISEETQPDLVCRLSGKLLDAYERRQKCAELINEYAAESTSTFSADPLLAHTSLAQIERQQDLAKIYRLAGNTKEAVSLLETAREYLQNQQASLSIELAKAAGHNNDSWKSTSAKEQAHNLTPKSILARTELAKEYVCQGRSADATALLQENHDHPLTLLAASKLSAQSDELQRARENASRAAHKVTDSHLSVKELSTTFPKDHQVELAGHLLDLHLFEEAANVANHFLQFYPTDTHLLEIQACALQAANRPSEAAKSAYLAVSLSPTSVRYHRLLAGTLEDLQDWDLCLDERNQIVQMAGVSNSIDLIALASSAIKANRPDKAIETCNTILDQNPDDGFAHTYLGEAFSLKGNYTAATQHLTQATLLIPDNPLPWVDLAGVFDAAGDHRKMIETLRSAAQAAPLSTEIHLALGQASLSEGSPTEALPALRRAANLAPESPAIALSLTETLLGLGRTAEAKQAIEKARHFWPTHPDLAYADAKALLAGDEPKAALPALVTALQSNPINAEPYTVYARTLLKISKQEAATTTAPVFVQTDDQISGSELRDARSALVKALEIDPDNFEGRLLMAEVQACSGNLQDALDTYLDLSETDLANDPHWSCRINLGLGKVALSLKQMDTAIAALQEAIQAKPDDLEIQQTLAEAYKAANLPEEAQIKARTALSMAPNDIANLIWYAKIAADMDDEIEAINSLEHAIELAPDRPDLRIHMANIQKFAGNLPAAQKAIQSIIELSSTTPTQFHQAANLFYSLNDPASAVVCLQKAMEINREPSADLWAELADLQGKTGDRDAAIVSIQNALELRPDDPNLHFIFGDMLVEHDRIQAALSCFEQALDLIHNKRLANIRQPYSWNYLPEDLTEVNLHLRMANLLRTTGDLNNAFEHAKNAVELNPEHLAARYQAADLAQSLLEWERAIDLIGSSAPIGTDESDEANTFNPEPAATLDDPDSAVKLLCLQAEMKMEAGDDQGAARLLAQAKEISATHPRVLADFARISAREGDFITGLLALESATANLRESNNNDRGWEYPALPLADAALELHQWNVALPLYQQASHNLSAEPLPQLSLARALVKAAEQQQTCRLLKATQHAPGDEKLGEAAYQQFEKAILNASRLCTSKEITRWHRRGQAAFHPAPQSVAFMKELATNPEDAAALISDLRQVGDETSMADITAKHADHPAILFQSALQKLDDPETNGTAVLQKIIQEQPRHPLYQALYAHVARKEGDPGTAYQAIITALETWPDEPYWQAFAAETAADAHDYPRSLDHWKKARDLEPENSSFAHSLGEAYLHAGDPKQAIQVLSQTAKMDPSKVGLWLSLAYAHRAAQDYTTAISCAEKAIHLAPDLVTPLLVSGEIALEAGQIELGYHHAQTALAMEPNHSKATWLFARAQALQGLPEAALQTIESSLPLLTEPYEALLERARLIRQLHGVERGLSALKDVIEQYPQEPEGLGEYAKALADAGYKDVAEKTAQSALLLEPNRSDLHLLLGRIQRVTGQLDQAIHHLSEAIRISPNELDAYLELGRAYQDRREHNLAQKVYQQASNIAPTDARPYYQTGLTMKECKDYLNAEKMLRRAAELSPDDLNIRRQLAAIIAINLVHNPQEASKSK